MNPDDIIITEKTADFVRVLVGKGEHAAALYELAIQVLRRWVAGDVNSRVTLPAGITMWGESTLPIGVVWEELGLAMADPWVRADNGLPEPQWEPLVDIVERIDITDEG
jgi:hypothetical protein